MTSVKHVQTEKKQLYINKVLYVIETFFHKKMTFHQISNGFSLTLMQFENVITNFYCNK